MHFFIIPGNPPARHFYEIWRDELKAAFKLESFQTTVDYFPAFDMGLDSYDYWDKMVEFYEDRFLDLMRKSDKKVVLVGHSVGGMIALEILKKHPEHIDKCVLIFPFLGKPGGRGQLVLEVVNFFMKSKRFIPFFLSKKKYIDRYHPILKKISDEEVDACFKFAYHERRSVAKIKRQPAVPKEIADKILALSCPNDTWSHPTQIAHISHTLNIDELDVTHDFVTFPKQREQMNTYLVDNLKTFQSE